MMRARAIGMECTLCHNDLSKINSKKGFAFRGKLSTRYIFKRCLLNCCTFNRKPFTCFHSFICQMFEQSKQCPIWLSMHSACDNSAAKHFSRFNLDLLFPADRCGVPQIKKSQTKLAGCHDYNPRQSQISSINWFYTTLVQDTILTESTVDQSYRNRVENNVVQADWGTVSILCWEF